MKQFFCIIAKGDVPIYQTQMQATASKMQVRTKRLSGIGGRRLQQPMRSRRRSPRSDRWSAHPLLCCCARCSFTVHRRRISYSSCFTHLWTRWTPRCGAARRCSSRTSTSSTTSTSPPSSRQDVRTQHRHGGRKGTGDTNVRGRTSSKNEMMCRDSGRPAAGWARLIRQRDCFSPPASTAFSLTVTLFMNVCAWLCRHALPVAARSSQG